MMREFMDLNRIEEGLFKKHADLIPYGKEDDGSVYKRSKYCMSMDGMWRFSFYQHVLKVPEDFYESAYADDSWDEIRVPSCWQTEGYGKKQYLNNRYPFPADPPYIPMETHVGCYRRMFTVPKDFQKKRIHLVFDGVCSAYRVWVNGKNAGFSQGSHMMGEFDITDLLCEGENVVAVQVYQYSFASYLECQDMWRFNGIFRSVYLVAKESCELYHIETSAKLCEKQGAVFVKACMLHPKEKYRVRLTLEDQGECVAEKTIPAEQSMECRLEIKNPALWSAETPNLYQLKAELIKDEHIAEIYYIQIGFRTIEIQNGVFLINGNPVKLKGVNHHDTSPDHGYTMSRELMEQDVLLMKQHNVNAVRTSHYPPDTYFLDLCDRYGLYVIDEADVEAHGGMFVEEWNRLAEDEDYVRDETNKKPLFLCEFAHSMGNSPGGLREYVDLFYQYDRCMGGCVWEWADHGVLDVNKKGEPCYRYGGDYGDVPNDGNFCCDGLCFPDRTPHTGLLHMKNIYAPVEVTENAGEIYLINRYDMLDFSGLYLVWEVIEDGRVVQKGECDLPEIAPHQKARLTVPYDFSCFTSEREYFLNLYFKMRKKTAWADTGYELCRKQALLSAAKQKPDTVGNPGKIIDIWEEKERFVLSGEGFCVEFSKLSGTIENYIYCGKKLIDLGPRLQVSRPVMDNDWCFGNDDGFFKIWKNAGVYQLKAYVREIQAERKSAECICITCRGVLAAPSYKPLFRVTYVFEENDTVAYTINMSYPAAVDKKLSFRVENYWGNEVCNNAFYIQKEKASYKLQMGKLPLGWYKLFIYDEKGKQIYEGSFSVVAEYKKDKIFYNSPFGLVVQASGEVNYRFWDDYIRAAQLTGVGWVRESWGYWDGIYDPSDSFISLMQKWKNAGLKLMTVSTGMNQIPPDNLFEVYQTTKNRAAACGDQIAAWELGNEPDLAFWGSTADAFSSYYKMGALGFQDSGADILKFPGGLSEETLILSGGCGDFAENMMMNGIMKYSDAYTYHSYAKNMNMNVSNKPGVHDLSLQRQASAYAEEKPMWLTEGGMGQMAAQTKDGGLYDEQVRGMARAAVQTLARSAAEGVQKHFWFMLHGDYNVNQFFSCFTNDGKPYAVYNALSNMTRQLGEGQYKGKVSDVPEYIEGYVFETEGKKAVVLWSDRPYEYLLQTDGSVRAADFMGESIAISQNDRGEWVIPLGIEPIYLTMDAYGEEHYYPETPRVGNQEQKITLTKTDRIIINQKFKGELKAKTKKFGYCIEPEKEYEFTVQVYNVNDEPMQGTVQADAGEYYELSQSQFEVEIPPMDYVEFPVTVKLKENAPAEKQSYFSIVGMFDGQETTPSVSRLYSDKKADIVENEAIIPNSDKAEAWDVSNIVQGGVAKATNAKNGAVEFEVHKNILWFFPRLKTDGKIFEGKSGFSYWVYADKALADSGSTMYIIVWLEDGRQYFLDSSVNFEEGWNQIKKSFDSFILMLSPFGALDDRPFEPSQIAYFSIGTNATVKDAKYQLRDIGYYTEESDQKSLDVIKINGITNNEIYTEGQIPDAEVLLPEELDPESIRVLLGDKPYEDYQIDQNRMTIHLKELPKGKYRLFVSGAMKNVSHIRRDSIDFMIQK